MYVDNYDNFYPTGDAYTWTRKVKEILREQQKGADLLKQAKPDPARTYHLFFTNASGTSLLVYVDFVPEPMKFSSRKGAENHASSLAVTNPANTYTVVQAISKVAVRPAATEIKEI